MTWPVFEVAVTFMVCEPIWFVGSVVPLAMFVVPLTAVREATPDPASAQP